MLTRERANRVLLQIGLGLGCVGVILYILSFLAVVAYEGPRRGLEVGRGAVAIKWSDHGMRMFVVPDNQGRLQRQQAAGTWRVSSTGQAWRWWPQRRPPTPPGQPGFEEGLFVVPGWLLIAAGVVSVYLLLPRGVPAGFCPKCRFDLRGVPELPDHPGKVRCPECGSMAAGGAAVRSGSGEGAQR